MIIMSLIKLARRFRDDGSDGKKEEICHRVSGRCWNAALQQRLPIVVYTPDNVDVKYRVWKAEEKIDNAVFAKLP